MSVFYVAQWSVRPSDAAACEAALQAIADHVRDSHPGVLSLQILRQAWGPNPRRAYLWMEEYASLSAMEAEPETPACAVVWEPLEALMLAGTYLTSVWSDPQRSIWFRR